MKRCLIILIMILCIFVFSGCGENKKETVSKISVSVVDAGQQLSTSEYDIMITVDGKEQKLKKTDNKCEFDGISGEIKGSIMFYDRLELEFGFKNDSDNSEKDIEVTVLREETEISCSQTVKSEGNVLSRFSKEATADSDESFISVFKK